MAGPLQHIRVLDLSRVLAGPWASQMLADLGADVVKIEKPGQGDDTRSWGPPYWRDQDGNDTDLSAYFISANRGKRSVAIDIDDAQGREEVKALAAKADIMLENFKVGSLKKRGLDYESLQRVNPGLIYCSITGFGQTGPYRHRAGYDFMIQGMSGLMSITGQPEGEPQKVGVAVADILTGLYAGVAVLAALAHRDRAGEGQYIDLALMDVMTACLANQASSHLVSGETPMRLGNAHPTIVPYQAFATADGHIVVAVGNDEQFKRFCGAAERSGLASDTRFARNPDRVKNRDTLIPILRDVMKTRSSADWLRCLEAEGIPCGPINSIADVFTDANVTAKKLKIEIPAPPQGAIPMVRSPMNFSLTPVAYTRAPPHLGAHTNEVLRDWLGLETGAQGATADTKG